MKDVKVKGDTLQHLKDVNQLTGLNLRIASGGDTYYIVSGHGPNMTSFGSFSSLIHIRYYLNGYKHGFVNARSGF